MEDSANFEERFRRTLKRVVKGKEEILDSDPSADVDIPATIGYEGEQAKTAKVTLVNLFQQPEAHPVVLDLALLRKYGAEWLVWEPETLAWRIPQDFHTTGVSDLSMDKIEAMKTLHYNDNYWTQWEVFNWCTAPFNNMYANFEVMQAPSTAQVMVSVATAADVRGDVQWSDEVKEFMVNSCRYDGIFCPPPPLEFLEVGTVNGLVDCEEVNKRWPDVKVSKKYPTKDSIVDEQLRRMLDAYLFLDENRKRLQTQLSLVLGE